MAMDVSKFAPDLVLGQDGWWYSRTVSAVSYPQEGNSMCFAIEDSSFWFAHRNRCILEAMKLFPPVGMLFDVGGGNGYVARAIQEAGFEVALLEPGLAGVRNALKRGIRQVVRATLEDAGVLPGTLPALGLFDVVEHIRDDRDFLARIHRLLIPSGRLYATIPAYDWLWSDEDVLAGHARRYTVSMFRRLLENCGYTVEFATYFLGLLPLPIFLRRVLPSRLGFSPRKVSEDNLRSDHELHPLARRMLTALNRRELNRIVARRPLKVGGSCLVVARKR